MAQRIILTDESINSYGFWVKTSGIDIKQFKRNPIMLWNHSRSFGDNNNTLLPIGKWTNIEVVDDVISAEPVFDLKDDFAQKIALKYEQGMISMASIGIDIIETSESKEHLKPGQTRQTVLKSKLREVSIVDIGSNDNAVALYDAAGKIIELSATGETVVGLIQTNKKEKKTMKELALALGLSADATEAQILSAIQSLTARATAAEAEVGELQAQIDQENQTRIASLVDAAVLAGKIPAGKKEVFMTIGKTAGEKALSEAIASIGEPVKPSGVILNRGNAADQNPKSFTQYTAAELQAMRSTDMSSYVALFRAEYGHEPNI